MNSKKQDENIAQRKQSLKYFERDYEKKNVREIRNVDPITES